MYEIAMWVWGLLCLIVGIALLIVEAHIPGVTYAIVPGTVLIIVGIVQMAWPQFFVMWWSPIVIAVLAIIFTALTIMLYAKISRVQTPTTTVTASLIGKTGIVTAEVTPHDLRGKVKIDNQTWSAISLEGNIEVGKKVQVVESEGVHVKVRSVE